MVRLSNTWFPFALFDELARGALQSERRAGTPALEIQGGEAGLHVRAALPGIDPSTLDVALEEGVLRVRARRPDPLPAEGRALSRELSEGAVTFALRLGFRPDRASVKASYEDGILSLDLPRSNDERSHKIDVETH